jgi:hypothetical protein
MSISCETIRYLTRIASDEQDKLGLVCVAIFLGFDREHEAYSAEPKLKAQGSFCPVS